MLVHTALSPCSLFGPARLIVLLIISAGAGCLTVRAADDDAPIISSQQDDGYRGIWFTLGQPSEYGDKYSGGLGTYTAKHIPIAVYAPEVERTFFVYGGSRNGERYLLAMASHYDHRTGAVPRPTIVHDKGVNDPHDNPASRSAVAGTLGVRQQPWPPGPASSQRRAIQRKRLRAASTKASSLSAAVWLGDAGFLFLFTQYTRDRDSTLHAAPAAATGPSR